MNIPDVALLRKAIDIKTELEELDHQLAELLQEASQEESSPISTRTKKSINKSVKKMPLVAQESTVSPSPISELKESDQGELSHRPHGLNEAEDSHEVMGMISSSKPNEETVLLVDASNEPPESLSHNAEETCSLELTHEKAPHSFESYYSSPAATSSETVSVPSDVIVLPETTDQASLNF